VGEILENVCPNCGGGFSMRPIRPKEARRKNVSLVYQPSSKKRVITEYTIDEIKAFSKQIKAINPEER